MSIFVTGATGYLGSYAVERLLRTTDQRLSLLVRAKDTQGARERLWQSLQLHMGFEEFREHLATRIDVYVGDLTAMRLGLDAERYGRLLKGTESVLHVAAALNRMSARLCHDVNLRGTLEIVELVRAIDAMHGVRRFSFVSTTAVAGERQDETIYEDSAIDFGRKDYDPYARTKKFCEHMIARTLPEVPIAIYRPAIVMGDTRCAATSQFDMVRATAMLARMKVLPLDPGARQDIVPADFVGHAIADLHMKPELRYGIYHLSAGHGSKTNAELMRELRLGGKPLRYAFMPRLGAPFGTTAGLAAASPRGLGVSYAGALLKGFWPYVTFNTIFDNNRVIEELGQVPAPFTQYGSALLDFAIEHGFEYPHEPWPAGAPGEEVSSSPA